MRKINTLPNGFIETISNLRRDDKIVVLNDKPLVETNIKLKPKPQPPLIIPQEPKRGATFWERRKAKREERDREKALEAQNKTNSLLLNLIDKGRGVIQSPRAKGLLSKMLSELPLFIGKKLMGLLSPKNLFKLAKKFIKGGLLLAGAKLIKPIIDNVVEDYNTRVGEYEAYRKELGLKQASTTQKIFGYLGSLFSDASKWAESATGGWIHSVSKKEAWRAIERMSEAISRTYDNIVGWLDIKIQGLKVWSLSDFVPDSISEWFSKASEKISTVWNNLMDWFDMKVSEISNAFKDMRGSLTKSFKRVNDYFFGTDYENAKKRVAELKADIETTKRSGLDDRIKQKFLPSTDELEKQLIEAEKILAKERLKAYQEAIKKGKKDMTDKRVIKEHIQAMKTPKQQSEDDKLYSKILDLEKAIEANRESKKFTTNKEALAVLDANIEKLSTSLKEAEKKFKDLNPHNDVPDKESILKKIKDLVNQKYINSLAHIETGTGRYKNPYNVKNKYGYTGKYQFGKSTAEPYLKKLGRSWKDFRGNKKIQEQVVRMFTEDNVRQLEKLIKDRPITALDKWIAHNQGIGGYKRIMIDTATPATGKILRNIRANVPKSMKKNVTKQTYIDYWKKRLKTDKVPENDKLVASIEELVNTLKQSEEIKLAQSDNIDFVQDDTSLM